VRRAPVVEGRRAAAQSGVRRRWSDAATSSVLLTTRPVPGGLRILWHSVPAAGQLMRRACVHERFRTYPAAAVLGLPRCCHEQELLPDGALDGDATRRMCRCLAAAAGRCRERECLIHCWMRLGLDSPTIGRGLAN
jgi:hypothetical protein